MLVLTRKAGEKIVIDGNIVLEIFSIKGNYTKIAIKAPKDVLILRGELVEPDNDGGSNDLAPAA